MPSLCNRKSSVDVFMEPYSILNPLFLETYITTTINKDIYFSKYSKPHWYSVRALFNNQNKVNIMCYQDKGIEYVVFKMLSILYVYIPLHQPYPAQLLYIDNLNVDRHFFLSS